MTATLDTDDEPTPTSTPVPHLKYVDDDACPSTGAGTPSDSFCSIQIAIGNASPSDTILVGSGTYTGPVTVNKDVTLTGQSSPMVIGGPITFDGSGTGAIIDGFAVIKIGAGAHGVTVRNNTISGGAQYGIHIDGASDNTIEDNELIGSSDCISLGELAGGNAVRRNTIAACDQSGVHVAGSNNTILDNTVLGAPVTGIVIAHLSGNLVENNLVKDSGRDGIAVILGATILQFTPIRSPALTRPESRSTRQLTLQSEKT